MIDITKSYHARDGRRVKIYSTDNGGIYPVHGAIECYNGDWEITSWTSEGYSYTNELEDKEDLIEIKPKVKYLKSIRQLLNEFPDAKWDENGWVNHPTWSAAIAASMLSFFGNLYANRMRGYIYDPQWIEERDQ